MSDKIRIPHKFTPREYQLPLFEAMDSGYRRAILVWARRAGKDKVCFNYMIKRAITEIGNYYYFFPTYAQGKKALWDNIDGDQFRTLHHIPKELIKRIDNISMLVELTNGSTIQVIGTVDIDSLVGTNPRGVVYSEYAIQSPDAWNFIRPILANNKGWVIFNGTPRGENHFYDLLDMAKADPATWFSSVLTVDDTHTLDPDALELEKREMFTQTGDDALFNQEYYCSFSSPLQGSYYSRQIELARSEGRIGHVPHDARILVNTSWDIGKGDHNVVWFWQEVGKEIRLIDCLVGGGKSLPEYITALKEKPYIYGDHFVPHDMAMVEYSGMDRMKIARNLGFNFKVVNTTTKGAALPLEEGIEAVRNILSRCWFDAEKCREGINGLKSYRRSYDEKRRTFRDYPEHDWASHIADSFRYLALGYRDKIIPDKKGYYEEVLPASAITQW